MIWYFSEGILSAQDSLISHALEMKDQGHQILLVTFLNIEQRPHATGPMFLLLSLEELP
jgi:hypothetical protein